MKAKELKSMTLTDKLQAIENFLEVNSKVNSKWKRQKKDFHIVLIALYSFNSFGIHTIGSVLRSHGFRVSYLFFKNFFVDNMELPTEVEYKKIIDLIGALKPDIVGIGTMSTFAPIAVELTRRIRRFMIPIIWGGAHAICASDYCIEHADFVCVGEGEVPMLELAYGLFNGTHYKHINNLWIRENGTVIKNDLNPLIRHLDLIPFPDFSDEGKYYIENDSVYFGEPYYTKTLSWYNFMSGRGCPFSCTYCCNSYLIKRFKNSGPILRRRSVDNVIEELRRAKSMFPKLSVISANDEVFVLNKEWIVEFCERYRKEINIPFHCDIHPSKVNDEIISLMKTIKLKTITLGIQAGSERIRCEVYKRYTPEEMIIKCANIFKKHNIFPTYDFIFDNPLETKDELDESLRLILKLPRPFSVNTYSLQYHPNTDLTSLLLSKGIIKKTDIDGFSLKGLKQWHIRLDSHGTNEEVYYLYVVVKICSYSFTIVTPYLNFRIPIYPQWLIRIIVKNKHILKRWIFSLKIMCILGDSTEKLGRALSILLSGNFYRILEKVFC